MGEHLLCKQEVVGSIPSASTTEGARKRLKAIVFAFNPPAEGGGKQGSLWLIFYPAVRPLVSFFEIVNRLLTSDGSSTEGAVGGSLIPPSGFCRGNPADVFGRNWQCFSAGVECLCVAVFIGRGFGRFLKRAVRIGLVPTHG